METGDIFRKKLEVEQVHGGWTAHNFLLQDGLYLLGNPVSSMPDQRKLRLVMTELRGVSPGTVLDLGPLEGLYSVELARCGWTVTAMEARPQNVARLGFSKEVIGLDNITIVHRDVRQLSATPSYDVVLCLGLLYHLEADDIVGLLQRISSITNFLIIDTHIALPGQANKTCAVHLKDGKSVSLEGFDYIEHDDSTSDAEKMSKNWSSYINNTSFWMTKSSLLMLLQRVGFDIIHEPIIAGYNQPEGRIHLVARKSPKLIGCPFVT